MNTKKLLSSATAIGCCLTMSYLIAKSYLLGQPILVGELNPWFAIPEILWYTGISGYFAIEFMCDSRRDA